jgi:homoserine dehydrogenase
MDRQHGRRHRIDADIVVEVMGAPARRDPIRRPSGKSVVTANKQLISVQGVELLALARRQKRELLFEASVAGGIPIVRGAGGPGRRSLFRIEGILNGTATTSSAALTTTASRSGALRKRRRWVWRSGSYGGRGWL